MITSRSKKQAHLEAGKASLAAGRLQEAIREFDKVLDLSPLSPEAHFYLGEAHSQTGDWDSATLHTRRAIEFSPKSPAYRQSTRHDFCPTEEIQGGFARTPERDRAQTRGACAADYDNDGQVDLYVTNFGPNVLSRNNGDGTFSNVTKEAGVGFSSWSSSCAFAHIDKDGDLDLFVVNYVDFGVANNKYCDSHVKGLRSYCHPNVYRGLPNVLYRNNGNRTFTEITKEAGVYTLAGKGLGVAFGDYGNDGWPDIYVANDSVLNFLYHNQGNGTFVEVGLSAGVAVDENGLAEAGMGTDWGDFNNDGLLGSLRH